MTQIEEFRRFCNDAGHYQVKETLDRFLALSDDAMAALLARWEVEDAGVAE